MVNNLNIVLLMMMVVVVKVIIVMMGSKVLKTTARHWHHCPTVDHLQASVITLTLSFLEKEKLNTVRHKE